MESLHDTCTLRRHISSATDEYGMPTATFLETVNVPCGFKTKKVAEVMGNSQVTDIVAELRLLTGTEIDGLDQVTLTKRNGQNIPPVAFKVEGTPISGVTGIVVQLANVTADAPFGGGYESDYVEIINAFTAHINNLDNPHVVTAAQVGDDTAQWNADKIKDLAVPTPTPGVLTSNGAALTWEVPSTDATTLQGHSSSYFATDTNLTAHTSNTSNPHAVTPAQVGNGTAQWNADKIKGVTVPTVASGVLTSNGATLTWTAPTLTKVAVVWDEKASGAGGVFATGAWRQRDLNTKHDPDNLVSVASNNVTILQAGKYFIRATAPAAASGRHQARLMLNGVQLKLGTFEWCSGPSAVVQSSSTVSYYISLNSADVLRLEHQCSLNATTSEYGFGVGYTTFGVNMIFSTVEIIRLGD